MTDHTHAIDSVFEGPLWFCKCGSEFFPKPTPGVFAQSIGLRCTARISISKRET